MTGASAVTAETTDKVVLPPRFAHRHLLSMRDLSATDITTILDVANAFWTLGEQPVKKLASLRGKTVINLFFENSTRTRTSFEIAAKRMGADAVNISGSSSSTTKGETLLDTVRNLDAMHPEVVVVRHAFGGAAEMIAGKLSASVINAGDGQHEHPTQALLDAATIRRHKGRIAGLSVAIVGDIVHSRVARSNAIGLATMGAEVRLCAPHTLIPRGIEQIGGAVTQQHVSVVHKLEDALDGADVIMMLRVQNERTGGEAPRFPNTREFSRTYGLSERTLAMAKPDAIVLHPGPINRGVEMSPQVADGVQSLILEQVSWGVAVRMAVLHLLTGGSLTEIS
jgi:aspartate carbamoyltransferase catalytic subunit